LKPPKFTALLLVLGMLLGAGTLLGIHEPVQPDASELIEGLQVEQRTAHRQMERAAEEGRDEDQAYYLGMKAGLGIAQDRVLRESDRRLSQAPR